MIVLKKSLLKFWPFHLHFFMVYDAGLCTDEPNLLQCMNTRVFPAVPNVSASFRGAAGPLTLAATYVHATATSW